MAEELAIFLYPRCKVLVLDFLAEEAISSGAKNERKDVDYVFRKINEKIKRSGRSFAPGMFRDALECLKKDKFVEGGEVSGYEITKEGIELQRKLKDINEYVREVRLKS